MRLSKKQIASLTKTARFVLDEKLDAAGFNPDGLNVLEGVEVTGDGDAIYTVVITITSLDIEQAQEEGK